MLTSVECGNSISVSYRMWQLHDVISMKSRHISQQVMKSRHISQQVMKSRHISQQVISLLAHWRKLKGMDYVCVCGVGERASGGGGLWGVECLTLLNCILFGQGSTLERIC